MTNRWIRFLLAVLAILAASGAAYRVVQDEKRLAQDLASTRAASFSADAALTSIEELKASLHAYVAPGQGLDFWAARSALLLDKVRGALLELDGAMSGLGMSLAESLDNSDRLASAEQRAKEHVRNGQPLLAGEVIFTEMRDLLDGLRLQVARARDQIATSASVRQTTIRREQVNVLGGAAAVLVVVMLLLVPTGALGAPSSVRDAGAARAAETSDATARSTPAASVAPAHRAAPVPPDAPDEAVAPELAQLCTDLASVTHSGQIEALLDRARAILDARGVIVWIPSTDRTELHLAAASGYDARVLARLGPIHRETGNLTADAFRENAARTSAQAGTKAAALAVPLPSPEGPAGVFSAELTSGTDMDASVLAAARVIAAQLGSLLGTAISRSPDASDAGSATAAARSSS